MTVPYSRRCDLQKSLLESGTNQKAGGRHSYHTWVPRLIEGEREVGYAWLLYPRHFADIRRRARHQPRHPTLFCLE
jgi:hypothetical protein